MQRENNSVGLAGWFASSEFLAACRVEWDKDIAERMRIDVTSVKRMRARGWVLDNVNSKSVPGLEALIADVPDSGGVARVDKVRGYERWNPSHAP